MRRSGPSAQQRHRLREPTRAGQPGDLGHVQVHIEAHHAFRLRGVEATGDRGSFRLRTELDHSGGCGWADYLMRSLKASRSRALICRAPSTSIDAMVRRASSDDTSSAMVARPTTWM